MVIKEGRKECVLLFLVRACYHPRDKGTVYFPPEGVGKKKFYVAGEAGDLNRLTHSLYSIYSTTFLFTASFSFLNCMDAKQEQSDLSCYLPISFSVHVGGYRKSVLYHWNNKEKVI